MIIHDYCHIVKTFDLIYYLRPKIAYNHIMTYPYIEIIKEIMSENKFSQQEFADILGVNQTTVSQWLLGNKKPGYDSIYLLHKHFGIEPNDLFELEK